MNLNGGNPHVTRLIRLCSGEDLHFLLLSTRYAVVTKLEYFTLFSLFGVFKMRWVMKTWTRDSCDSRATVTNIQERPLLLFKIFIITTIIKNIFYLELCQKQIDSPLPCFVSMYSFLVAPFPGVWAPLKVQTLCESQVHPSTLYKSQRPHLPTQLLRGFLKDQPKYFRLASHVVSFATTQLCSYSIKVQS